MNFGKNYDEEWISASLRGNLLDLVIFWLNITIDLICLFMIHLHINSK